MYLNKLIDEIAAKMKSDDNFENINIIKAYPYVDKPTILKKQVITVHPYALDLQSIAVEQQIMQGEYSVEFDIFSPFDMGSPSVCELSEKIMCFLKPYNPINIKSQGISVENTVRCYKSKFIVTLSDFIDLGGDFGD